MVSITGVSANQAGHYYTRDNYYSKSEGMWQGKGAEALGLTGKVEKEIFDKLIHGKAPDGTTLVSYEPRLVNGQMQEPRAGIDPTFSAPKSVSILSEVIGDKRVSAAHEAAVTTTVAFMEKQCSQARKTDNGITEKIATGNLIVAKFMHLYSRQLDPHLHSHAVTMSITKRPDGEYRALSNEKFFENKMLLGMVYRSELAANLKELGYSIRADNRGLFEIEGIDKKLIDHYSQRSEQIERKFRELKTLGLYKNADDQKLREIACLGSRIAKRDIDLEQVRESWTERMKELGFTRDGILEATRMEAEKTRGNELIRAGARESSSDHILQAARIITEQESVFSREDILKTSGKLSLGKYRISDLDKGFHDMVKKKEIVTLDRRRGVYTTKEIYRKEQDILKIIRRISHEPILTKVQAQIELEKYESLQQKLKPDFKFTDGQKAAAEHVLTSRTVALVQGDAGTGKTAFLHAVRLIAETQKYEMRGLSYTGKAAEEIQKASGIQSQTLHSFLANENKATPAKQLWIVDEASMVGSKQLHSLLTAAEHAKANVVLIGDIKQLQAIQAGKMFQKLQQMGINSVEMTETLRQKNPDYKNVVNAISAKQIDSAFEKLDAKSRINENADSIELKSELVKDYVNRRNFKDTIIVTALNNDRRDINQAIRGGLKLLGKLNDSEELNFTTRESKGLSQEERHYAQNYSPDDIIIINKSGIGIKVGAEARIMDVDIHSHSITVLTGNGERTIDLNRHGDKISVYRENLSEFTHGDKVVFLKNDKSLDVQNGLTGSMKTLHENGDVTVRLDNGRDIRFNLNTHYNYIDHGYAVTDFKAQGQTSKEVFYHAETAHENKNTYNSFYVAVTRGQDNVRIYTDNSEALKDQVKHEQQKSSTLDYAKEDTGREAPDRDEKSIDSCEGGSLAEKTYEETGNSQTEGNDLQL